MIPRSRERLENEYKTLKFIAEHTTIPVPRIFGYSVEGEVASLTLETIEGEIVSDLILDLGPEDKERLLKMLVVHAHHYSFPTANSDVEDPRSPLRQRDPACARDW